MYKMFMVATFVTYIFRNPLGNILLAVGKASGMDIILMPFAFLYIIFSLIFYQYWGCYSNCLWFVRYIYFVRYSFSFFFVLLLYKRFAVKVDVSLFSYIFFLTNLFAL